MVMKVVHIVFGMEYGGIETMLVNIMNEQIKHADISLIIVNNQEEKSITRKIDKRIRITRINRPAGSKNPFYIFALNYLLWKRHYDIIHVHIPDTIKFIFLKSIIDKTGLTVHHICTNEDIPYLHKYKHIFAISKSVQNDLSLYLKKDIPTILNGINCTDILPKKNTIKNQTFHIVQIGRLAHALKGQDILIEAISILYQKGYKNISVDFIGDGESKDFLKNLVKSKQLEEQIHFLGSKEQSYIFTHLKDYDLFVQPSRREGFGLTVTEAMAAKVPVLVSNQEGPMEIIENGKYGYYFESNNINSCANEIEKIMIIPRYDIVIKAHQYVINKFDVKRTALEYIHQYRKMYYI
ncbi:glycosyltransferase family 4 protein [Parabacteroides goldsteinii]|uniref:glycosyltransferase family 4 protein n=1 Tax=Parabacteroides goldsteinii TaxID=328812 RepID=UPI00241DC3F0|nr:glycosyltransferase family 4 protein [Parabacteroides goldsteinii]